MRWPNVPDGTHIHKLDWTGLCTCGFTLSPQRRVVHARTHTGVGVGPVYVTIDIGVNRCMMVQKSCNVPDIPEAIQMLEQAIGTLREVEMRKHQDRRQTDERRESERVQAQERRRLARRVVDAKLD